MSDDVSQEIKEIAELLTARDMANVKLSEAAKNFIHGDPQASFSLMLKMRQERDGSQAKALVQTRTLMMRVRGQSLNGALQPLINVLKRVPSNQMEADTPTRRVLSLFEVMSSPLSIEDILAYLGIEGAHQQGEMYKLLREMVDKKQLEVQLRLPFAPPKKEATPAPAESPKVEDDDPLEEIAVKYIPKTSLSDPDRIYALMVIEGAPIKSLFKFSQRLRISVADLVAGLKSLEEGKLALIRKGRWKAIVPNDPPVGRFSGPIKNRALSLLRKIAPKPLIEDRIRMDLKIPKAAGTGIHTLVKEHLVRKYRVGGVNFYQFIR